MSSGILCFEHCNCRIFVFNLPKTCPRCTQPLDQLDIIPFRISSPFIQAKDFICSIVIKPTTGSFLKDYNNLTDLHIGLVTSSGLIVEYDQTGLKSHLSNQWNESLLIYQLPKYWYENWDRNINKILQTNNQFWTKENYCFESNNCYSFVMEVLRQLDCELFADRLGSKIEFCEYFIAPKIQQVRKYILMYRKLITNDILVEDKT